ncbi:MAG: hypothetical protein LIQ31_16315 [Planctomycetes bacterium]|nr:hypothetical protein [Planctomycetota bacterium]
MDHSSMTRFEVHGNVLKLTPRFDPRYQSRAGTELMNIVTSLAADSTSPEVVLDISDAQAVPSMMIGMLCEARDVTDKAGKKLKIRLKTATYHRLQSLGLANVFSTPPADGSVSEDLELVSDAVAPEPD